MAGFVPSPNTIKVLLHWTIHGRPQLNVLHTEFITAGPFPPGNAQSIFDAAAASLTSSGYVSSLATTTSFTGVTTIDIRNASNTGVTSTGAAVPGTSAAVALPDQVSLVLTLRTAQTGRSHRGRIYLLGLSTDDMDADGTLAPGTANAAVTWVNSIKTQMSTLGMTLAIRSPALPERPSKPGGMLPAKPFEITPVTIVQARDRIPDTNRRRQDLLRR